MHRGIHFPQTCRELAVKKDEGVGQSGQILNELHFLLDQEILYMSQIAIVLGLHACPACAGG